MLRFGMATFSLALFLALVAHPSEADSDRMRVEEEISRLARELDAAIERRDRAGIERVFDPGFHFIHAFGYVDSRDEHVEALLARAPDRRPRLPVFAPPASLRVLGEVAVHQHPGVTNLGNPARVTTLYARVEGSWRILQSQATEMIPEPAAVPVDRAVLDRFTGRYERHDGVIVEIAREGDSLFRTLPGFPKVRLTPLADDRFQDKVGGEWTFRPSAPGRPAEFVHRFRDRRWSGTRIEP